MPARNAKRNGEARSDDAGGDTKQRILAVTTELMSQRGYAGTSISTICEATDLAPPAIYWHFGNKEGLLAAVIEASVTRWHAELVRAVDDAGRSMDSFRKVIADSFRRQPQILRLMLFMGLDRHHPDPEVRATVQRMRAGARDLLAGAIATVVPLGDPEPPADLHQKLARLMLVHLDGIFLALEIDEIDEELDELLEMMQTGIAAVGMQLLDDRSRRQAGGARHR